MSLAGILHDEIAAAALNIPPRSENDFDMLQTFSLCSIAAPGNVMVKGQGLLIAYAACCGTWMEACKKIPKSPISLISGRHLKSYRDS